MISLKFTKIETDKIDVIIKVNGNEKQFSYLEMIKSLISDKKMEDPEISGDFTEAEKKSIRSMVRFINEEISGNKINGVRLD